MNKLKRSVWLGVLMLAVACSKGPESTNPVAPAAPLVPATPSRHSLPTGEVGNGGHGVVLGGKVRLYDFVESGITSDLRAQPKPHALSIEVVNSMTLGKRIDSFPAEEFAGQLEAITHNDPLLGKALVLAFQMLDWRLVDFDLRLLKVPGDILQLPDGSIVQLANRRGRTVYINREGYKGMEPWERAGLFMHEIVYALIRPVEISKGVTKQLGERVREIVSHFFHHNTTERNYEGFARIIDEGELPYLNYKEYDFFKNTLFGGMAVSMADDVDKAAAGIYKQPAPNRPKLIVGKTPLFSYVRGNVDAHVSLELGKGNPLDFSVEKISFQRVCEDIGKNPSKFPSFDFRREGEGASLYDFMFADYIDAGEVKSYIRFEKTMLEKDSFGPGTSVLLKRLVPNRDILRESRVCEDIGKNPSKFPSFDFRREGEGASLYDFMFADYIDAGEVKSYIRFEKTMLEKDSFGPGTSVLLKRLVPNRDILRESKEKCLNELERVVRQELVRFDPLSISFGDIDEAEQKALVKNWRKNF